MTKSNANHHLRHITPEPEIRDKGSARAIKTRQRVLEGTATSLFIIADSVSLKLVVSSSLYERKAAHLISHEKLLARPSPLHRATFFPCHTRL